MMMAEVGRVTAGSDPARGRDGRKVRTLRRAGCWVTPREGDLTDSATEKIPPTLHHRPPDFAARVAERSRG